MRVAPTGSGSGLPAVQGVQAQVHGGGHPPEHKTGKAHPSRRGRAVPLPLFMESEPEEESASETSETSLAGLVELEGAI